MEKQLILERVKKVIHYNMNIPLDEILPDGHIVDFSMDSIDFVNIFMEIENEFDICIEDDVLERKQITVDEICDEIKRRMN